MPRVRYFAQAREAAGTSGEELPGATVAEVLAAAVARHGEGLQAVLAIAAVWLDGAPCSGDDQAAEGAEVAVLPPVSGGSDREAPCRATRPLGSLFPWPSTTPSPRTCSTA